MWKLLLSIDIKTVFLLLIFSGGGLPVLRVRVFFQCTHAIPTHVRLNFVTKQYTHCTEKHVSCNVCHLVVKYSWGHITFQGMLQHVLVFSRYSRDDLGGINVLWISVEISDRHTVANRPLVHNGSCDKGLLGSVRICVYLLCFCHSSHAIWVVVR